MSPLGGNDIGDIINAAHTGNYSGLASLGDDNTATLLSTELTNQANLQQARETNDANRRLHEMDNAFNADEADKARSFQHQMWQEQNEYNSPSAQKERLISAGLNPLSLSGLTSQPVQSSVPSAPSASASSPIPMQSAQLSSAHLAPYSARGVDIAAALTNVANSGKGFADTMVSLRNVKNQEAAQFSQSKLNFAKVLQTEQETSNLRQQHDLLTPASIQNIYSQIHQREHQNKSLDNQSELFESNVALNDAKISEIKQAITESNARIDNLRNQLGWQYYNTNVTTSKTWPGIFARIAEGADLFTDITAVVKQLKSYLSKNGNAKSAASEACDFVTQLGNKAVQTGNEKLTIAYSAFKNALPRFLQDWATRWEKADARYRKQALDYMNSSNSSVVNPVPLNSDTYSGN